MHRRGGTLDYLGLFCLGVFAAAITAMGLRRMQVVTDWRQVLVVTLPVLLAGAAVVLVDRFRYSPGAGAFPLGLVVGLLWSTIAGSLDCLKSTETSAKVIGWTHVAAASGLTVASTLLVVVPAVSQVGAEVATPREVRVRELRDAQGRANGGSPSRTAAATPDKAGAATAASAPRPAPLASAPGAAASR